MDDPKENLNKLMVPLPDVRMHLVALMKDGVTDMPLGDFIVMIQQIIKKSTS
jgi:hypothetical protein